MNENIAKVKRSPETTLAQFTVALRRILVEFRTDKKGAPGKCQDRIERLVVGSNAIKQDVLLFLFDTGMIIKEKKILVINKDIMKSLSLSMHSVCAMNEQSTGKAYVAYCAWRKHAHH